LLGSAINLKKKDDPIQRPSLMKDDQK
jgi:hypothetical protein